MRLLQKNSNINLKLKKQNACD